MLFRKTRVETTREGGPPQVSWEEQAPAPGGGRTIIGAQTRIRGTIRGDGSILLQGTVEGGVAIRGAITVTEGATMDADVEADTVDLAGEARGSMRAESRVAVASTGQFEGDITTPILDVRPGSILRGRARVAGPGSPPRRPLSH